MKKVQDLNSKTQVVGGVVPREYIPAVQAGIEDALDRMVFLLVTH